MNILIKVSLVTSYHWISKDWWKVSRNAFRNYVFHIFQCLYYARMSTLSIGVSSCVSSHVSSCTLRHALGEDFYSFPGLSCVATTHASVISLFVWFCFLLHPDSTQHVQLSQVPDTLIYVSSVHSNHGHPLCSYDTECMLAVRCQRCQNTSSKPTHVIDGFFILFYFPGKTKKSLRENPQE